MSSATILCSAFRVPDMRHGKKGHPDDIRVQPENHYENTPIQIY